VRLFFPPDVREQVQTWAGVCELAQAAQRPLNVSGYFLWWDDGRLVLYENGDPGGVCLQPPDFERRATLNGELARACGVTTMSRPRVLDAMAGLGLDGMTLNALGCDVVMVERNPALWAMLDSFARMYGLDTAKVVYGDAWEWLQQSDAAEHGLDVVYLDPMFPARRKGALPGKSMQFLSQLTEADVHGVEEWVELARRYAGARVVLKRRLRDPLVGVPDWQIKGRAVRYDVYRGSGGAQAPRSTA